MRVEPERGSPTMKIGALLGSPPACASKERRAEERANARGAPLEAPDVERSLAAAQRVALRVVSERPGVLPALLAGLAEREIQLRVCRASTACAFVFRDQPLHGGDLGVGERIVLQVGEAPPGLGVARICGEHLLVGGLALGTPPERLAHVADGHQQSHVARLVLRRALVGLERLLLAHEPRRHRGRGDPALRAFGLDLHEAARGRVRLLHPTERQQRSPESAVRERQVLALPQRVAQQPLGIPGYVRRK